MVDNKMDPFYKMEHICNYAAFDIARGDVCKACRSNPPSTLNLYEVTVYPQLVANRAMRTTHVLVLAVGLDSAERNALKALNMADPGGRIRLSVAEVEGPFKDGHILSVRES